MGNEQKGQYLDTGTTAAMSAGGNIFGGILNLAANHALQKAQWGEQRRMQERAFELNEQAVQNQAELMKTGLENAGLNPAMTGNAAGAPSVAAGSAASASTNLEQVFSGLSELVTAIKAPTEIEKTQAETEKTGAETTQIFTNLPKIQAEIKKTAAEAQNITNINNIFDSETKFLKSNAAGIFTGYIGQLKATKQWENLPTKTKMTLEDLAEGNIELDQGRLAGLQKIIDMQGNLSERDKQVLANTKQMIVDYNQIKDKKVIEALTKMPETTQEKIIQDVRKIKAEVNNLREQNKNLAEQRKNMKQERIVMTKQGAQLESQAKKNNTEREIQELNDMQYLIDHDRWEDAARLGAMTAANDLWNTGLEGAKEAVNAKMKPAQAVTKQFINLKNFK